MNWVNKQVIQTWWWGGWGAVDSVNWQTGVVVLDTGDIAEATNANYVSDAQLVVIGNTSGTNTGDNAVNSLYANLIPTETEVDFGTIPVSSKKFTITNASINTNSKIIVSTSWNTATDRVGNDWEFDSCTFSAKSWSWDFTLSVVSNWHIRWKRKLFYSFS